MLPLLPKLSGHAHRQRKIVLAPETLGTWDKKNMECLHFTDCRFTRNVVIYSVSGLGKI